MRVADYVIDALVKNNINDLFVITGRGILFLTDALAKHPNINPVSMHNEQAVSYAAYAYSKLRNNLGACLVSTGCASTNTITGVLNAWQDHVPVVYISGNNPTNENVAYTHYPIRTYGSQEADIISIVKTITKYSVMITDASKIVYELEKAFYYAMEGIKGPVWIDIPLDIQDKRIEPDTLEHFELPVENINSISSEDLNYLISSLNSSSRPVCLIGDGIRSAESEKELKAFIEKNKIPLVYSPSAVNVYPSSNELSIGCVSSLGGSREANFLVQNCDLLLVAGCRMPSMLTGGEYDKFAKNAKKIVIDIDDTEPKKGNINYDKIIIADIRNVLLELNKNYKKNSDSSWVEKCLHWKNALTLTNQIYQDNHVCDLYNIAGKLTKTLPESAIVITDAGFEELVIPSNVKFTHTQFCIHPFMQGSMGFSLPAVIGAYYSSNKSECVVSINGDGSIMMNLQELQTIAYYKIPAKIIVINNDVYAVIRKRQKDLFRTRTLGTDFSNGVSTPNWSKIADCFGLRYLKIQNNGELEDKLQELFSITDAVLCEIISTPDQKYLHTSIMKNEKGLFERRPMEDQSPFLSRKVFYSEMLNEEK